jgi:small-conductance mechanosensitive channel
LKKNTGFICECWKTTYLSPHRCCRSYASHSPQHHDDIVPARYRWNHAGRLERSSVLFLRCNFPITGAYGTDPELVRDILLDIAENHPGVLKDKKADVLLDQFGESGLNMTLRVWTRTYTSKPGVLQSEINYEIARKFEQHGIQIPSPQRDVFLRGGAIKVMPD